MITSDGFFELEDQPKRVMIIGSGYIAVELAGIFKALGTEVVLSIRYDKVLRKFDDFLSDFTTEELKKTGIKIIPFTQLKSVSKCESGLKVELDSRKTPGETQTLEGFNQVLCAVGRAPNTADIALNKTVRLLPLCL